MASTSLCGRTVVAPPRHAWNSHIAIPARMATCHSTGPSTGPTTQTFRLSNLTSTNNRPTPSMMIGEPAQPVQPATPAASGPPVGAAGLALLALAAVGVVWRKLRRSGSLRGLEDRGYSDQNRFRRDEYFAKDVMKNVNTVPMPSLSDDQINAARNRRLKERGNHKMTLEDIELPDNHPWATKNAQHQQPHDGERVRARLQIKRSGMITQHSPEHSSNTDMGRGDGSSMQRGGRGAPREHYNNNSEQQQAMPTTSRPEQANSGSKQ